MDISLTGLISAMITVIFLTALLGLLFNLVLSSLEQSKLQMNFYLEAQRVASALNLRLSNAVWTDPTSMGLTSSKETYSFRLAFYNPQTLTLQYRTLMFDRNSKTIKLDNTVLVTLSSEVEEVKFKPFYRDGNSQAPECVLLIAKPKSHKIREYTFPILTYLSGSY